MVPRVLGCDVPEDGTVVGPNVYVADFTQAPVELCLHGVHDCAEELGYVGSLVLWCKAPGKVS
jgi:hypothetical protein